MRNSFKVFVSIENEMSNVADFLQLNEGYPIDNVIQIKLSKGYFVDLFRDTEMSTSGIGDFMTQRYNSDNLLLRLGDFFDKDKYNNHNNWASDISILVKNTYNDVDINPVALETACSKNGDIFNYFFSSNCIFRRDDGDDNAITHDDDSALYDDTTSTSGSSMKVYQVIGRELDNMISRNYLSTSEDNSSAPDTSYDDLDDYYAIFENDFWDNVTEGDSIFIEGSFLVPTTYSYTPQNSYDPVGSGNLPVILQFVCSDTVVYGYQIPPVLLLTGSTTMQVDITNGAFVDPGYTALNYNNTDITSSVNVNSGIPAQLANIILGTAYSIQYSISSDGFSVSRSRSVTFVDSTGPVISFSNLVTNISGNEITFNGDEEATVVTDYDIPLPGQKVSAVDEWDTTIKGNPAPQVLYSGVLYANKSPQGYYGEISYTSTDQSQNTSSVVLFIRLLAPITMLGGSSVSYNAGSYSESNFTAFNGVTINSISVDDEGAITNFSTVQNFVNFMNEQQAGTYVVSYNVSSETQLNQVFNRTVELQAL